MSDAIAEYVRRFGAGDAAVEEILAKRACALALRTASVILGSREEAADIAQDVAVDVLLSLHKLRDPDAFDAWVHRISVRHAMRLLRRRQAARAAEVPLALLDPSAEPPAPVSDDPAALVGTRNALARALAELPPRQRLALALRYIHDLPDSEIAKALDCRVGTAHALLSRGREALRRNSQLSDLAPARARGPT